MLIMLLVELIALLLLDQCIALHQPSAFQDALSVRSGGRSVIGTSDGKLYRRTSSGSGGTKKQKTPGENAPGSSPQASPELERAISGMPDSSAHDMSPSRKAGMPQQGDPLTPQILRSSSLPSTILPMSPLRTQMTRASSASPRKSNMGPPAPRPKTMSSIRIRSGDARTSLAERIELPAEQVEITRPRIDWSTFGSGRIAMQTALGDRRKASSSASVGPEPDRWLPAHAAGFDSFGANAQGLPQNMPLNFESNSISPGTTYPLALRPPSLLQPPQIPEPLLPVHQLGESPRAGSSKRSNRPGKDETDTSSAKRGRLSR